MAPIAASSARVKLPKPSSVSTPYSSHNRRVPALLSKALACRSVITAPASPISSSSPVSQASTSRGASRASSGARRGRGQSITENAPVEMSTQASAPSSRTTTKAAR